MTEVPYERQADPDSNRMCGAAALCMVYRSFGRHCDQAEIWPRIFAGRGSQGLAARTHLLAADAIRLGLAALVLEARNPWGMLEQSLAQDRRVILNLRLTSGSLVGHYAVLVGLDDSDVLVHDPQFGPRRRLTRTELLELWTCPSPWSEITGRALVVVADEAPTPAACPHCASPVPSSAHCGRCGKVVPLQPGDSLVCVNASCPDQWWSQVFCPWCDASLFPIALAANGITPSITKEDADMSYMDQMKEYTREMALMQQAVLRTLDGGALSDPSQLFGAVSAQHGELHQKMITKYRAELGIPTAPDTPGPSGHLPGGSAPATAAGQGTPAAGGPKLVSSPAAATRQPAPEPSFTNDRVRQAIAALLKTTRAC